LGRLLPFSVRASRPTYYSRFLFGIRFGEGLIVFFFLRFGAAFLVFALPFSRSKDKLLRTGSSGASSPRALGSDFGFISCTRRHRFFARRGAPTDHTDAQDRPTKRLKKPTRADSRSSFMTLPLNCFDDTIIRCKKERGGKKSSGRGAKSRKINQVSSACRFEARSLQRIVIVVQTTIISKEK